MNKLASTFCSLFFIGISFGFVSAQCDPVAKSCSGELGENYLSDGQYYRAQIVAGEEITLNTTLYEGFTYRVVACTQNDEEGNVQYNMFDSKENMILNYKGEGSENFWDFQVSATDEFTFKATLDKGFGCVVFVIGFNENLDQ